jgi:small-conductance mechanosensitive channel
LKRAVIHHNFESMNEFWNYTFWNNTVRDWIISVMIIIIAIAVLRLLQSVVIKKVKSLSAKTKTTIDDFIISAIQSFVMPILYVLAFYFGIQYLELPAKARSIASIAIMVVITFFVLRIISSSIGYLFKRSMQRHESNLQREKQSKGILLIVQVTVWLIGLLFMVDNLGYDITTIVAGLGIGGIAVALAAQTILGDLFSYLVIFFDKPFEIGDFIIVDDKMGTIEYIGIKTTRIRTLSGEQLICSNTDLTNSRVHNYKRMEKRRVVFSFGVVYHTPAGKLRAIPGIVKEIIESTPGNTFDRAHFSTYGDFSLNFEVVYYVMSADYNVYMDRQQSINIELFERFELENIEFAYPTQTILFNKEVSKQQVLS